MILPSIKFRGKGCRRRTDKRCRGGRLNRRAFVESRSGENVQCTHHRHLHIGRNAYRNHAASDFRAQTYARIKSLRNNIDKPAFADQFQSDIGIALFKYCQLRQQDFINGMLAGVMRTVPEGV